MDIPAARHQLKGPLHAEPEAQLPHRQRTVERLRAQRRRGHLGEAAREVSAAFPARGRRNGGHGADVRGFFVTDPPLEEIKRVPKEYQQNEPAGGRAGEISEKKHPHLPFKGIPSFIPSFPTEHQDVSFQIASTLKGTPEGTTQLTLSKMIWIHAWFHFLN